MSWYEEIMRRKSYCEEDIDAFGSHSLWENMMKDEAPRDEFLQQMLDPDIENEFCYYNIENWDKLIQMAKEDNDDAKVMAFQFRLIRACLIYIEKDPEDVYEEEEISEESLHRDQIKGADTPIIFDFEPENCTAEKEYTKQNGYVFTTPEGERHIYAIPNPQFGIKYKDNYHVWFYDRYGNPLAPSDQDYQRDLMKQEQCRTGIINEHIEQSLLNEQMEIQYEHEQEKERIYRDFVDFCDDMILLDEED